MNFDPELLQQKLAEIKAMQEDIHFLERKQALQAERLRLAAEEKKVQQAARKALQEEKRSRREIEKRAKEVAKAKQVQRLLPKPEKRLETRALNLEEKIPVRIDSKTVVYMKPGDDPERIRAKYRAKPIERLVYYQKVDKNDF